MENRTDNTALLVMDMQDGILSQLPQASEVTGSVAKAVANARSKNIRVIYVVVGFRPGAPETTINNKSFSPGRGNYSNINMNEFMKVDAAIAPLAGEITVVKRRISAFTGSDLEVILRAQNIRQLVLSGISTSGVVLSTVREAADKDYRITVLADCCADRDEEVHRVLTTKVFPRQADVLTLEEWCGL
ncbi:MAG: isochorismatase family cysteine hydrolase [Mucilaginibacter sp.]|uniref:isochorismatase family cysteine hydrolase n=1 Tax=Mucilaginibacter sp. TaxID=1882438 RepID=UPI0034E557B4